MEGKIYRLVSATNYLMFKRKAQFFLEQGYKEAGDFGVNNWGADKIYHQFFISPNQTHNKCKDNQDEPGHPVSRQKIRIAKLDAKIKEASARSIEDAALLTSLTEDLAFYDELKATEQYKVRYKDRLLIDDYKKTALLEVREKKKAKKSKDEVLSEQYSTYY